MNVHMARQMCLKHVGAIRSMASRHCKTKHRQGCSEYIPVLRGMQLSLNNYIQEQKDIRERLVIVLFVYEHYRFLLEESPYTNLFLPTIVEELIACGYFESASELIVLLPSELHHHWGKIVEQALDESRIYPYACFAERTEEGVV